MPERHAGFGFGWCAVMAPLAVHLPHAYAHPHARLELAIPIALSAAGLLVYAMASAFGLAQLSFARVTFWTCLLATWTLFWLLDLRHANAQVWLAAVVAAGVMGALLARSLAHGGAAHLAAAFMIPTFALLWSVFLGRADNGCTGVSEAYGAMLFFTELLVFVFGPTVIASHLAAIELPPAGR